MITICADRVEFKLNFTRPGVYLTYNEIDLSSGKKEEKKTEEKVKTNAPVKPTGPGAVYEETKPKECPTQVTG